MDPSYQRVPRASKAPVNPTVKAGTEACPGRRPGEGAMGFLGFLQARASRVLTRQGAGAS